MKRTTPRSGKPGEPARRSGTPGRESSHRAKQPLKIPPLLLEGDPPPPPPAQAPAQKFALGPQPPAAQPPPEPEDLPEAYGTQKLLLAARDPHCLYAHWDLTAEQQRRHSARAARARFLLRLQPGTLTGQPSTEFLVEPELRHQFIHVERAAAQYVAELGYYQADGKWVSIATSVPALTPPDTVSDDKTVRFATLPLGSPTPAAPSVPSAEPPPASAFALTQPELFGGAPRPLQPADGPEPPPPLAPPPEAWTAEQERALTEALSLGNVPLDISSPAGGGPELPFSPMGGVPPAKGFWLNLAADLVLYGATAPDASVTIAGQPVELRPDGSFSFRMAFPDGQHAVVVVAISADNDQRQAQLKFSRSTEWSEK